MRRLLASAVAAAALAMCAPAIAGSVTYTYDEQGRVSTASYSGGTLICYAYDAAGNRTGYSVASATACAMAPVGNAVTRTVMQNSTANPITLSLSGGMPTSVTVSTAASHGTASASGTSITYTPTSGYLGSDTFQYTATNAAGTSSPATASITVVFAPVQHEYGTSGTETVPTGATTVTITLWSGGGAGGRDNSEGGGGGGGGCQAVKTIAVTGGNTLTYTVGSQAVGRTTNGLGSNGSASSVSGTVSGGSVSLSTSTAAHGGAENLSGGSGAVCSGGTDTSGAAGGGPYGGTAGGAGGGAGGGGVFGSGGTAPGGGGSGGFSAGSGAGAAGQVIFAYR